MSDAWMTVKDAARVVRRTPHYVQRLISSGRVNVKRERGGSPLRERWFVDIQSLRASVLPRGAHTRGCECVRCVPVHQTEMARVKMSREMLQALQREARLLQSSVAEVVRTAVELYLSEGGQDK